MSKNAPDAAPSNENVLQMRNPAILQEETVIAAVSFCMSKRMYLAEHPPGAEQSGRMKTAFWRNLCMSET